MSQKQNSIKIWKNVCYYIMPYHWSISKSEHFATKGLTWTHSYWRTDGCLAGYHGLLQFVTHGE